MNRNREKTVSPDQANRAPLTPLYQDPTLAQTLSELGMGAEIPPELHEALVRILVHVAVLDKKITK
ncbi:hypothetical protein [Desulforamulus ruminis]|uniref:Uncharacterized protein n=1 Tax=Desulforamulus ruminis (strain ATCC 23193 / DSM 2154 / NCIMB 8452 / DL) TaxID=696281 RepID=F6DPG7_DESRL|nr:hypothetical protein [Desulforamulus ruminis]AEG58640.1 hypothetical protein Desru_0343 [Desulforamulus ruminis DSM 2154]